MALATVVWVLGCGPSLAEVPIPPDVLTIGVNDSYRHQWSPIYATADREALDRDYPKANALKWYTCQKDAPPAFEWVDFISVSKSGPFGYMLACEFFGAERVKLLGFDMETRRGHFNDDRAAADYEEACKPALRVLLDYFQVDTEIWRDGWVPLEEVIPEYE